MKEIYEYTERLQIKEKNAYLGMVRFFFYFVLMYSIIYFDLFVFSDFTLGKFIVLITYTFLFLNYEIQNKSILNEKLDNVKYVPKLNLSKDEKINIIISERIDRTNEIKRLKRIFPNIEKKGEIIHEFTHEFGYAVVIVVLSVMVGFEVIKNIINANSFIIAILNLFVGVITMYLICENLQKASINFDKNLRSAEYISDKTGKEPILQENVLFIKDNKFINTNNLVEMLKLIDNNFHYNQKDLLLKISRD